MLIAYYVCVRDFVFVFFGTILRAALFWDLWGRQQLTALRHSEHPHCQSCAAAELKHVTKD
jgi:hypothetical protein